MNIRMLLCLALLLSGCRTIESVTSALSGERNPWNTEVIIPNKNLDAVDENRKHESEWAGVAQGITALPLAFVDNVWGFFTVVGAELVGIPIARRDIDLRTAMRIRSMGSLKKATILRNAATGGDDPHDAKGGAKIILEFHEPPAEGGEDDKARAGPSPPVDPDPDSQ